MNESNAAATTSGELLQPENGLRGLKHWPYDLRAGLIGSLTWLPLTMGIALASGAPAIAGPISAIIAGFLCPLIGGSYVTMSGPAAGLAPVLLGAMSALGAEDLKAGYPRLLVVIAVAGLVQILLTTKPLLKWLPITRFAAMLPRSAVTGMVAAIGLSVICKQIPNLLGTPFTHRHFFAIIGELPSRIGLFNVDSLVITIGAFCLVFALHKWSASLKQLGAIPPELIAVLVGIAYGRYRGMSPNLLIHIPNDVFSHGNILEGLEAFTTGGLPLWEIGAVCLFKIVFVDAVESLATVDVVDDMDRFRRKSDPRRALLSIGVCNLFSSICGGLTIIPNVITSSVCIKQGGRTLNANFFSACFLLLYVVFARTWINFIPLAALAGVLIYIGYNLSKPPIWVGIWRASKGEFVAFFATVVVSLYEDLLVGVGVGTAIHYCLSLWAVQTHPSSGSMLHSMVRIFRNPIAASITLQSEGTGRVELRIHGPITCFNKWHLLDELRRIPEHIREICLVAHLVPVVDTSAAYDLDRYRREYRGNGTVEIKGLDLTRRLLSSGSHH